MPGLTRALGRRAVLLGLAAGVAWYDSVGADSLGPANRGANELPSTPATDGNPAGANGAARWLEQSEFVVSSLETGRVGYVEAWGGDEFGYSYTYSLAGQPRGVSIDAETGILS